MLIHVIKNPQGFNELQIFKPQLVQILNPDLQLRFNFLQLLLQCFKRLLWLSDVPQDVAVACNALIEPIVICFEGEKERKEKREIERRAKIEERRGGGRVRDRDRDENRGREEKRKREEEGRGGKRSELQINLFGLYRQQSSASLCPSIHSPPQAVSASFLDLLTVQFRGSWGVDWRRPPGVVDLESRPVESGKMRKTETATFCSRTTWLLDGILKKSSILFRSCGIPSAPSTSASIPMPLRVFPRNVHVTPTRDSWYFLHSTKTFPSQPFVIWTRQFHPNKNSSFPGSNMLHIKVQEDSIGFCRR